MTAPVDVTALGTPQWAREFSPDYDVPEIFHTLPDLSWHHDACPCFGFDDGEHIPVVVYVFHVDPARRDQWWLEPLERRRFVVVLGEHEMILCTDDATEAVNRVRAETLHYDGKDGAP